MRNLNNRGPQRERKPLSPEKRKFVISTAINAFLLTVVYFGAIYGITDPELWAVPTVVMVGYWATFGIMLLVYIIYNRAFTRKNITEEMLPPSWSKEKKTEYIENGKTRLKKSEWMLSLIIPILVPIALDALYLFTLPIIQNLFGIIPK